MKKNSQAFPFLLALVARVLRVGVGCDEGLEYQLLAVVNDQRSPHVLFPIDLSHTVNEEAAPILAAKGEAEFVWRTKEWVGFLWLHPDCIGVMVLLERFAVDDNSSKFGVWQPNTGKIGHSRMKVAHVGLFEELCRAVVCFDRHTLKLKESSTTIPEPIFKTLFLDKFARVDWKLGDDGWVLCGEASFLEDLEDMLTFSFHGAIMVRVEAVDLNVWSCLGTLFIGCLLASQEPRVAHQF